MKTITIEQAESNFNKVIQYALTTHDEVNIVSNEGAVVVMPQDDYQEMLETLRLLSDKNSLNALLEGHKARRNNETLTSRGIDEAFSDIQS